MIDLKTRYMGLDLPNPIIVSSCGLTKSLRGVQKCAEAGAGAIVLKSLFEEQIAAEASQLTRHADLSGHTEAIDYLQGFGEALGPAEYLQLVRDAKKAVDVPIIPSINCITDKSWAAYAGQLAAAGADALEVNIGFLPNDVHLSGVDVEKHYARILHEVYSKVELPVALKVGPYFSSFANVAGGLCNERTEGPPFTVGWCGSGEVEKKVTWRGANALVLFNRFYSFDIDVDAMKMVAANPYSTSDEIHMSLRWISLLAGKIGCDLTASTGVHTGSDVVKQLLAGATAVQVCSTLYRNGLGQIGTILEELKAWMEAHNYSTLKEFRGRLSQVGSEDRQSYERLQYIKALVGRE